jgi:hypothetical protein
MISTFQFFVLDVVVNSTRLSNDNLYAQLRRIRSMAEEEEEEAEEAAVGILTAARRDRWAKARAMLMEGKYMTIACYCFWTLTKHNYLN